MINVQSPNVTVVRGEDAEKDVVLLKDVPVGTVFTFPKYGNVLVDNPVTNNGTPYLFIKAEHPGGKGHEVRWFTTGFTCHVGEQDEVVPVRVEIKVSSL